MPSARAKRGHVRVLEANRCESNQSSSSSFSSSWTSTKLVGVFDWSWLWSWSQPQRLSQRFHTRPHALTAEILEKLPT